MTTKNHVNAIFSNGATSPSAEKIDKTCAFKGNCGESQPTNVSPISNKDRTRHVSEKMSVTLPSARDFIADLDCLTRMELRKRYKAEANSHRNMLHRQKTSGAVVHPDFEDFVSFLRYVGPIPAVGATLDRINNPDPEYAPGKVRWADKRTQNANKGDSLTFHNPETGEIFTTSRLAKKLRVSPGTIRKQFKRGWSDAEIIEGQRSDRRSVTASCSFCPNRQRPNSNAQSVRRSPRSASEVLFERMAEGFRRCREEHGEEALPAPPDDLNEGLPLGVQPVTPENYERKFRSMWPDYIPHLIFDRATPFHQELIAKIDPGYVERWRAKTASKAILAEVL